MYQFVILVIQFSASFDNVDKGVYWWKPKKNILAE